MESRTMKPARHDLAQRTTDFYRTLLSDFPRACREFCSPDIVWENPLPAAIPFGGTYRGLEGMATYFQELMQAIEMSPLHFDDILVTGSVVAAVGVEGNTLVRSTGRRYDMPFVHVLRFDTESRVVRVREYNDIRYMLEAFA